MKTPIIFRTLSKGKFTLMLSALLYILNSTISSAQDSKLFSINNQQETRISKQHYLIQADNPEHLEFLTKCADKFPYWYKYRLADLRIEIEILPPYSGKIILFSSNEIKARPANKIDKQNYEALSVKLHAGQGGFKEVIKQQ